jgi:uncharacterized protein YndB with AHSA1/START domain
MNDVAAAPEIHHATFTVERTFPVAPARVFRAFADQARKRRWFAEGEGWEVFEFKLDFRVGGAETSRFAYQGGPEVRNDTVFHDIVADRRIVLSYRTTMGPRLLSACLSTTRFTPAGDATQVSYTEQGAYFEGGAALAQGHEQGSQHLFERLAAELAGSLN